ncbi:hypothetical protein [Pontibacter akesuensis]|uniref:Uncharacterized protein n=1 Tax=Pontibacter akesuensis TaxID=388950 RepID=A0A1I7KNX3_9BACT|nr:hypothetical protein [Pontibacter akesuensis]GHA81836.1 hypothetical protein GCM10007389_40580 [Pontibacter akesuensis]SFU99143.1 hypothetical protein SAMN04487941_3923 [Pontibacter akesuensis]
MAAETTQALLWDTILMLRGTGRMTSREAAAICLVRFTWTPEQAKAKLEGLQERLYIVKRLKTG